MIKLPLTLSELNRRWDKIQKDDCGAAALKAIKQAGWDIAAIPFDGNTWPGIIAAIPSMPSRKAGSSPQSGPKSAAKRVMLWARGLARAMEEGYRVEARDSRKRTMYMQGADEISPERLREMADAIEGLAVRKDWVVTRHNIQQNQVAQLRWEVRQRCGSAMDNHILELLDATFRAAGKEGVRLDRETLKKILTTETRTRVKARRKLGN